MQFLGPLLGLVLHWVMCWILVFGNCREALGGFGWLAGSWFSISVFQSRSISASLFTTIFISIFGAVFGATFVALSGALFGIRPEAF